MNFSTDRLTSDINSGRALDIEEFLARGGFKGLAKALKGMEPQEVIETVKASGLLGRGGAAFPAGLKWEFTSKAPVKTRYVACNADESEPGTFKDRMIMEGSPFRVIEGLCIAGYAVGASEGYIFIRGEYKKVYLTLQRAIDIAEKRNYLGKSVLGSRFDFRINLFLGAGAYICGEETGLFAAIEGRRPEPAAKPPFPPQSGLFGKPTVINNVETLINVPFIVEKGSNWFREIGTPQSPGTKLFCLSGHVKRPGLYEAPLGTKLGHIIYDMAGGVRGEKKLKAVLCGGAAGHFLKPDLLDTPMDYQSLAEAGFALGSGAIVVIDETADLASIALNILRFFAHESCGLCTPCRVGAKRMLELASKILDGAESAGDMENLADLAAVMQDASLCGLGQSVPNAFLSLITQFPGLRAKS